MRKIAILTIYDKQNFGNRLQNYAIQEYIEKNFNFECYVLSTFVNNRKKSYIESFVKATVKSVINFIKRKKNRKAFSRFDKNIRKDYTLRLKKIKDKYDFVIVGSDQIWNPNFLKKLDYKFLDFLPNSKKIAFSPSIGISHLTKEQKAIFKDKLKNFDYLSCREKTGSQILSELLNKKIPVLLDPTFMLSSKDWMKVESKPKNMLYEKYLLLYFLGKITDEYQAFINNICEQKKLKIINIMDESSYIGELGPSEFIYLVRNADIILTDSFHACVFSTIFSKPFIIFKRKDNKESMYSRIDNLIQMLGLHEHIYDSSKCLSNYFNVNYSKVFEKLKEKQIETNDFISKALNRK